MPKRKSKKTRFVLLLNFLKSNVLIVLGLLLISIFLVWRYHQERILSFNIKANQNLEVASGVKPVYIKSYPLGIDVSVKESRIVNGVWTINPNSANFLISSKGLGEEGNTLIYGHNKNEILGPLRWASVDTIIEVTGSDNTVYKYKVIKTDIVDPDNLKYVLPTESETLTLYTCTGFLDSKRFVAIAKRVNGGSNQNKNVTSLEKTVTAKYTSSQVKPLASFTRENVYITYYGFDDNDPPGRAIAYPKTEYPETIHSQASGSGTYEDPITVATSIDYLKYGTKIYIPYIKRYGVVEDFCATCNKNYKNGLKHIDIWAGGNGTRKTELTACEEEFTRESAEIIINPPNNLVVTRGPICF